MKKRGTPWIVANSLISGAALGAGIGTVGAMGAFSYSPMRKQVLPEVPRGTADIGVCKSVRIVNISETSWFDERRFHGRRHECWWSAR